MRELWEETGVASAEYLCENRLDQLRVSTLRRTAVACLAKFRGQAKNGSRCALPAATTKSIR